MDIVQKGERGSTANLLVWRGGAEQNAQGALNSLAERTFLRRTTFLAANPWLSVTHCLPKSDFWNLRPIWSEWCLDAKTKRQKDKKRQKKEDIKTKKSQQDKRTKEKRDKKTRRKKTKRQGDNMTKWQNDQITLWQYDKMARWQKDKRDKQKKDKRDKKTTKRQFDVVISGQLRTIAMFYFVSLNMHFTVTVMQAAMCIWWKWIWKSKLLKYVIPACPCCCCCSVAKKSKANTLSHYPTANTLSSG